MTARDAAWRATCEQALDDAARALEAPGECRHEASGDVCDDCERRASDG